MKKLLVLLAFAFALLSLCGCKKETVTAEPPSATVTAPATKPPTSESPVSESPASEPPKPDSAPTPAETPAPTPVETPAEIYIWDVTIISAEGVGEHAWEETSNSIKEVLPAHGFELAANWSSTEGVVYWNGLQWVYTVDWNTPTRPHIVFLNEDEMDY
jgi:hypothetical protein